MNISDNLKQLRKAKGALQKDVAEYLGVTQKTYSGYELGQREPSISTILKLCDYFDVTSDELLGRK